MNKKYTKNSERKTKKVSRRESFDQVPPNDIEGEELLLAAHFKGDINLLEHKWFMPEIFYKDINQKVAKAILEVKAQTPFAYRKYHEEDVRYTIMQQLAVKNVFIMDIKYAVNLVVSTYYIRRLIGECHETMNIAYVDGMYEPAAVHYEKHIDRIIPIYDEIENLIKNAKQDDDPYELEGNPLLVKTHYPMLDENIYFAKDQLIIIAGESGHGKTRWVFDLLCQMMKYNDNLFISAYFMEDSKAKMNRLFLSRKYKVPEGDIREKKFELDLETRKKHSKEQKELPIKIHGGHKDIKTIVRESHAAIRKYPDKLIIVVIDNKLTMIESGESEDDMFQELVNLKSMNNVCIILLDHLRKPSSMERKSIVERGGRRMREEIKGSEAASRAVDSQIIVTRPGEYYELLDIYDEKILENLFITEITKNRNKSKISVNIIRWYGNLDYCRFAQL